MAYLPCCGKADSRLSLVHRTQFTIRGEIRGGTVKKYMIEREIPKVGTLEREQLREAAAKSNQALRQLGPDVQWIESFVAADKTFCVYLAKDEAVIRRHAELSGFPATKITEISKMIDPTTAQQR
jgi:Protein of unknown function (DUF4242)